MTRALTVLIALLVPAVAGAQSLRCQTSGYCTADLECFPDDEFFRIVVNPDQTATFGWEGSFQFTAKPLRRDGFTAYINASEAGSIQTLALADDLTATFSLSAIILDELYTSFQVLTCQRM